jgi:hypothetical protein
MLGIVDEVHEGEPPADDPAADELRRRFAELQVRALLLLLLLHAPLASYHPARPLPCSLLALQ